MNKRDTETRQQVECLIEQQQFGTAKQPCERLLQRMLQVMGKRHRDTAAVHCLMGQVFLGLERPQDAISTFEKAIAGFQSAGSPGDVERSDCLVHLFKAKTAAGLDRAEAFTSLSLAADIRKKLLAPNNAGIADLLSAVSLASVSACNADNVRPRATAAIAMAQYMYGTGYVACLAAEGLIDSYVENLESEAEQQPVHALRAGVDGDIAVCLCKWLIEQYATLFGAQNERLIDPLSRLAALCEARGLIDQAVAALERKLAISEQLGNLTPDDSQSHFESLDRLYGIAENWPKQIIVLKELLAMEERNTEDANEYRIAELADRIGTAYLTSKDFAAAFSWYKRAVAIAPADENDKDHAVNYRFHLGNAYHEHGNHGYPASYRKALSIYREALRMGRAWLGRDDRLVSTILCAIGSVLSAQDSHGEAMRCYREALKAQTAQLGADDPTIADTLNDLALVHVRMQEFKDACRLLRRALAIAEPSHGAAHIALTPILNSLGVACAGCQDYPSAITHLERVVQILENTYGAWSVKLIQQLQNLGDVYDLSRRKGEAETTFQRALDILREKLGADDEQAKEFATRLADLNANKPPPPVTEMWVQESPAQWP
jgi:tetratricopeptide (TPR) repeat protein